MNPLEDSAVNPTVAQGRAKGGLARADVLSPEERKSIARKAAAARWDDPDSTLRATHTGQLQIGDLKIDCAVLKDGSRVISQKGFARAMGASTPTGIKRRGAGELPVLITAANLKPFIDSELEETAKPIWYKGPGRGGFGIRAEVVPKICEVWLKARDAGKLRHNQVHLAKSADILVRALASVGIVALVDEATGYQEVRDRKALQQILDRFIGKELAKWVKTFPDDFYQQVFRLKGWEYRQGSSKRPMHMAKLTADLVYSRLAPGVLEELRRMTPKNEKGRRKTKLFQGLTTDIGHPALKDHIAGLTFLAKTHRENEWGTFYDAVNRAAPQFRKTMLLPFPDNDDTSEVHTPAETTA
jgi:P63C domain